MECPLSFLTKLTSLLPRSEEDVFPGTASKAGTAGMSGHGRPSVPPSDPSPTQGMAGVPAPIETPLSARTLETSWSMEASQPGKRPRQRSPPSASRSQPHTTLSPPLPFRQPDPVTGIQPSAPLRALPSAPAAIEASPYLGSWAEPAAEASFSLGSWAEPAPETSLSLGSWAEPAAAAAAGGMQERRAAASPGLRLAELAEAMPTSLWTDVTEHAQQAHHAQQQDWTSIQPSRTLPTGEQEGKGAGGAGGEVPQPPRAGSGDSVAEKPGTPSKAGFPPNSPQAKVERILGRHGQSFCEEMQIPLQGIQSSEGLWQWLCASVLFSARIKSNAAVNACKALFARKLNTPESLRKVSKEECRQVLHDNGYERYDEKTATFLVEDARIVLSEYGGDLNRLRELSNRNPAQERALLKKFKGVGDGGVDIFFREVQLVWEELFPFADKKALKAARLVGLREHPQSLADLCGQDRQKYVRLLAALVRIELSKTYHEY